MNCYVQTQSPSGAATQARGGHTSTDEFILILCNIGMKQHRKLTNSRTEGSLLTEFASIWTWSLR